MRGAFKPAGVLVACYIANALGAGQLYARSGIWGKTFRGDGNEFGYRSAVISYGLLAVALVFLF